MSETTKEAADGPSSVVADPVAPVAAVTPNRSIPSEVASSQVLSPQPLKEEPGDCATPNLLAKTNSDPDPRGIAVFEKIASNLLREAKNNNISKRDPMQPSAAFWFKEYCQTLLAATEVLRERMR